MVDLTKKILDERLLRGFPYIGEKVYLSHIGDMKVYEMEVESVYLDNENVWRFSTDTCDYDIDIICERIFFSFTEAHKALSE